MKRLFYQLCKRAIVLLFGLASAFCVHAMDRKSVPGTIDHKVTKYSEVESSSSSDEENYCHANSKDWESDDEFYDLDACILEESKGDAVKEEISDVSGEDSEIASGDYHEENDPKEESDDESEEGSDDEPNTQQNDSKKQKVTECEQEKSRVFGDFFKKYYRSLLGVGFIGAVVLYCCYQYFTKG